MGPPDGGSSPNVSSERSGTMAALPAAGGRPRLPHQTGCPWCPPWVHPTHLSLCPDLQSLRVALAVLGKGCFGISLTCLTIYRVELFPTPLR